MNSPESGRAPEAKIDPLEQLITDAMTRATAESRQGFLSQDTRDKMDLCYRLANWWPFRSLGIEVEDINDTSKFPLQEPVKMPAKVFEGKATRTMEAVAQTSDGIRKGFFRINDSSVRTLLVPGTAETASTEAYAIHPEQGVRYSTTAADEEQISLTVIAPDGSSTEYQSSTKDL